MLLIQSAELERLAAEIAKKRGLSARADIVIREAIYEFKTRSSSNKPADATLTFVTSREYADLVKHFASLDFVQISKVGNLDLSGLSFTLLHFAGHGVERIIHRLDEADPSPTTTFVVAGATEP